MINKYILSIFSVLLLGGCAMNYNTPFINTTETTQLDFGMTKADILDTLGEPLFVKSGGDGLVVFVYEVRTIQVESKIDGEPNKYNSNQKHGSPIHQLELTFENGRLLSWGESGE